MEVKYRPPLDDVDECEFLEENLQICLKEKAVKDEVEGRKCNVENILWFFLECPTRVAAYENKESLRQIYIQQKLEEVVPQSTILKKKN